jgi:hypothetical protein
LGEASEEAAASESAVELGEASEEAALAVE